MLCKSVAVSRCVDDFLSLQCLEFGIFYNYLRLCILWLQFVNEVFIGANSDFEV